MPSKITELEVMEISLVDEPANEEARVVLLKRKEPTRKLMDEPRSETARERIERAMKAIRRFLRDPLGVDANLADAITHAASMVASLTKGGSSAMKREDIKKALGEIDGMTDELVEGIDKALEAAESAATEAKEATEKAEAATKRADDAEAELAELKKGDGDDPEKIDKAKLPEDVRKALEDSEAKAKESAEKAEALEKRLDEEKAERERETIAKRLDAFESIAEDDRETLTKTLVGLDEEGRETLFKQLKAADEREKAAFEKLAKATGHDGSGNATEARDKIEEMAKEKLDKGEAKDIFAARVMIRKANPDLAAQERDERQGAH